MDQRTVALLSSPNGLNILKRKKSAGSMVLRNQQTDAPNFVKLFMKKAPLRGNSSYKRGLHLMILSPENRKRGGSNHVERLSGGSDIHAQNR